MTISFPRTSAIKCEATRAQSANGELTIEELRVAFPDVEFRVFPSARIESGELQGAIDLRGKNSSRSCVRIPRESVISFLEARQIIATTDTLARRGDKYSKHPSVMTADPSRIAR